MWRAWLVAAMLAVVSLGLAGPVVSLQVSLGGEARELVKQLPVQSEVVTSWPSDDELWLHHDARHLLVMELSTQDQQSYSHLFHTLDREFQSYAVYRVGASHLLFVMSRGQSLPWPHDQSWLLYFVADKRLFHAWYALHQNTIRQLDWMRIGEDLPLHMLYSPIKNSRFSPFKPPPVGSNHAWQNLNIAVSLADPELMLTAAVKLIGSTKEHYSFTHRQYVLGVAMLANAMMKQYASALLLWDKYSPELYTQSEPKPALDILLLRNYCLEQLNHQQRAALRKVQA